MGIDVEQPGRQVRDTSWMSRARCIRYADDEDFLDKLFFPTFAGTHGPSRNAEMQARRCCALCPVRRECLSHALDLEPQRRINEATGKAKQIQLLADASAQGITEVAEATIEETMDSKDKKKRKFF